MIGCYNYQDDEIFEFSDEEFGDFEKIDIEEDNNIDDNKEKEFETLIKQAKIEMMENGNFSKAVELYNKLIDINPNVDWLYGERGYSKIGLNNLEGAIEDCSRAIELNKKKIYYLWRAEAYEKLGEKELAQKDRSEYDKLKE